jgi:hypothetical protein
MFFLFLFYKNRPFGTSYKDFEGKSKIVREFLILINMFFFFFFVGNKPFSTSHKGDFKGEGEIVRGFFKYLIRMLLTFFLFQYFFFNPYNYLS